MIKAQKFQARVGKVESAGKVTKVTLGTSRNANAGKKKSDGSWEDANWTYSNWFATFFGDTAKRIQVGDVLTIEEAQISKEVWEHDNKKDYPLQFLVFDGKWSWKAKGGKKDSSPEAEDPDKDIPF